MIASRRWPQLKATGRSVSIGPRLLGINHSKRAAQPAKVAERHARVAMPGAKPQRQNVRGPQIATTRFVELALRQLRRSQIVENERRRRVRFAKSLAKDREGLAIRALGRIISTGAILHQREVVEGLCNKWVRVTERGFGARNDRLAHCDCGIDFAVAPVGQKRRLQPTEITAL